MTNAYEPSTTDIQPGEYDLLASEDIAINIFNMWEQLEFVPKPYKDHVQWLINLEYSTLGCNGKYNY